MSNDNNVVSGDAMALSAELRAAFEQSWKRNEAEYRYLATEGMSDTELRVALAEAQTAQAHAEAEADALRATLAEAEMWIVNLVEFVENVCGEGPFTNTAKAWLNKVQPREGEGGETVMDSHRESLDAASDT